MDDLTRCRLPGRRCVLLILDGWGIGEPGDDNAVWVARTPTLDMLVTEYPHTRLRCAGPAVGLPEGIMGNSEVGHLNIGAGRVVYQSLLRIDKAIEDGTFQRNPALLDAMETVRANGSGLHLLGLVSDGGVHSQMTHLYALVRMAKACGLERVFVHAILDGRDTPPQSGIRYVAELQQTLTAIGCGRIASICGRYYAMDRDTRWDRTEQAFRLYTSGKGYLESDPVEAVRHAYARGENDEFIQPVALTVNGQPAAVVRGDDAVVFFNFRPDRARQITRAFTEPAFDGFSRQDAPRPAAYVCMTQYDESFGLPVAFGPVRPENILGEVVSRHGLRQLRLAETEKYAHVTYFLNGGNEEPFRNEDRLLIPSPRGIRTYDEKPEMSAPEVAREAVERIVARTYDLIVINFANLDMVGHTGILDAAVKACEAVDRCVAEVLEAALENGYAVLVTADHGNSEKMASDGIPYTAHTLNDVPFVLIDPGGNGSNLREGVLGDIAPTVLEILGLPQPEVMTGKPLIID